MTRPPILINVTRGNNVESRHQVHAIVMDDDGRIITAFGDAKRLTYPRSTLKPLQAVALIESGAAEAFHLSSEEIALATASHGGEEKHTSRVEKWLGRLNVDKNALECGGHAPYAATATAFNALHNNCSGKHAGMITLSLFLKAPVAGYTNPEHPAQRLILKTMSELCGTTLTPGVCGIDGCSAPAPCLPLENLALGLARFISLARQDGARGQACQTILASMRAHPDLVSGTGRFDTLLIEASQRKIISKIGAEGVHIALIPEHNAVIALKAEDGAARAAQAALFSLLEKYNFISPSALMPIRPMALPVLKNWAGKTVGQLLADF